MKKLFNYILLPSIFLLSISLNASINTDKKDFVKKTNQSFKLNNDGTVKVSNKFGKVEVDTWSKNQVEINITVTVKTDSESNAENMFNRISFRFADALDYVQAETSLKEQSNSWSVWNWGSDDNDLEFSIDYDIRLPRGASLELFNQHGDAVITSLGGSLQSNIQHGDISIQEVNKDVKLDLSFGSGYLGNAKKSAYLNIKHGKMTLNQGTYVSIDIKHSNFKLGDAQDLKIISKHGEYNIGTIQKMRCDSKYDEYQIRSANDFEAIGKFSDFEIKNLKTRADIDMQHGDVELNISSSFDKLFLNGSHSSFKVWISEGVAFQFDGNAVHGNIRLPQNINVNYEKEERHEYQVECSSGNGNKGQIKAKVVHGSVKIIKE